jgi:hypothetical protein
MTIWRLEHGAILDVKGQVLAHMALALQTTTDYLLGLREDEQPTIPPPATRQRPRKAQPVA